MCNLKKKHGFTLAEVLITLGIIGVVAALCFPQVVTEYRKAVLKVQLKKAYADISRVNQRIIADGQNLLQITEATQRAQLVMSYMLDKNMLESNTSWLGSTERLTEIYEGNGLYSHYNRPNAHVSCDNAGVWRDNIGRLWLFNDADRLICVDINGVKGPNRYGYDYFIFYPDKNSGEKILPHFTDIENEFSVSATSHSDYTYYALFDIHPTKPGKSYWKDYLKF